MKAPAKIVDGGRKRCADCGHPKTKHHFGSCAVPKCECTAHVEQKARK